MELGNDAVNGFPRQILKLQEDDHKFEIDLEALEDILLQEHVKDKPLVVVSVAGPFRKGKSFLLSFFLRYLRAKGAPDWLSSQNDVLDGFRWQGGRERVTTGIHMWSKPFLVNLPDGTEVAVLLMDTQGTFDNQSTLKECATVFALSTMLSSVLIYNISQNIHEYDLEHLQLFTDYGKLALVENDSTPFQKLQFLVRDYPDVEEFGENGGDVLIQEVLKITENTAKEHKSLRRMIKSCFSEISCFLLPYPGKKVAGNSNFVGSLSDIDEDFKDGLLEFVPQILASENLIVKNMNGNELKAKDFVDYFKLYYGTFESGEISSPQTLYQSVILIDNLMAIKNAVEMYTTNMNNFMELLHSLSNATIVVLEEEHEKRKSEALDLFAKKKKIGGTEASKEFYTALEKEMDDHLESYKVRFECHKKMELSISKIKEEYLQSMMDDFTLYSFCNITEWEKRHRELCEDAVTKITLDIENFSDGHSFPPEYKKKNTRVISEKLEELFEQLKLQLKEKQELAEAVEEIKELYRNQMEDKCGLLVKHLNEEIIHSHHLNAKETSMHTFYIKSVLYDAKLAGEERNKLDDEINIMYKYYTDENNKKKRFEKEVENIIELYKHRLIDVCMDIEENVDLCQERLSKQDCALQEYALTIFYERNPKDGTELYVKYDSNLRERLTTVKKEYVDTLVCESVLSVLKHEYEKTLQNKCNSNSKKVHPEELCLEHLRARNDTLAKFRVKTETTGSTVRDKFLRKLENELAASFERFRGINEGLFQINMADWNEPHVKKWKENASSFQQDYYDLLKNRKQIQYSISDTSLLEKHVGFAMFGAPVDLPTDHNCQTGYNKKQLHMIKKLCRKIVKQNSENGKLDVLVDFIFVSALINEKHHTYCVIHVKKPPCASDFYEFFDCSIRGYLDWKDFLDNNELPECFICFPRNGIYSAIEGKVVLDFDLSAACRISRKLLKVTDYVGSGVVVVGGVTASAVAAPVIVPAAAGAVVAVGVSTCVTAGIYGIVRKFVRQFDRSAHGQSMTDEEGKKIWMGIVADGLGLLSAGSAVAVKTLGRALTYAERAAVAALSVGSSVVNGLMLVNDFVYFQNRLLNGEMPNALDAFQFSSTVFFFTNSVITTNLAFRIMECTSFAQSSQLSITCLLPLLKMNKLGSILKESILEIRDFILNKCQKIVKDLIALYKKDINFEQFLKETERYFTDLWNEMKETVTIVCQFLGVSSLEDIEIGGKKVFENKTTQQVKKFCSIILGAVNEYKTKFLNAELSEIHDNYENSSVNLSAASDQFGKDYLNICVATQKCKNLENFMDYSHFVRGCVEWHTTSQQLEYERALRAAENSSPNINRESFDANYGIEGNRFQYFCSRAFEKLWSIDMDQAYAHFRDCVVKERDIQNKEEVRYNDLVKFIDYDDVTMYFFHNWVYFDESPNNEIWHELSQQTTGLSLNDDNTTVQMQGDLIVVEMDTEVDVKCVAIRVFENDAGKLSGIITTLHCS